MTRVNRRMYRRRQRRTRTLRLWVLVLLAALCVGVVAWKKPGFVAELLPEATPTPVPSKWDETVVTRDVTLAAETWYTIQTGVFSAKEAAEEKASAYADRGAPGVVVEDGGKWRVFIASYGTEAEASAVRQRLADVQSVETYLYHWTCPELRLRLSGMAGQLDVAEAGLTLFSQAGDILRDTAVLLDAAQLTAEEALREVAELDGQITLWAETAQSCFGRNPPDMVARLLSLADGWQTRRKAIEEAAVSATALSAALKVQGMGMFAEMTALRAGFGGT